MRACHYTENITLVAYVMIVVEANFGSGVGF
jgi:hypothetical protein